MKCALCDRVALRVVGKNGFCKVHHVEAFKSAATENRSKVHDVWRRQEGNDLGLSRLDSARTDDGRRNSDGGLFDGD
jgi:hypothetical protein